MGSTILFRRGLWGEKKEAVVWVWFGLVGFGWVVFKQQFVVVIFLWLGFSIMAGM